MSCFCLLCKTNAENSGKAFPRYIKNVLFLKFIVHRSPSMRLMYNKF